MTALALPAASWSADADVTHRSHFSGFGPRWRLSLLVLSLISGEAAAQPDEAAAPSTASSVQPSVAIDRLVDQLLRQGKSEEASRLLAELRKQQPENVQLRFLAGVVAMAQSDYRAAIGIFRAILIDHPEAVRVRLELARAFFLDKDYANADRQFRFARAGKLPRDVLANIDAYLFAIRQSKEWSYSISLSIAPDTNINAGSSAREVTLYGLPFELDEDARHRSGIGLAVEAGVEWAPRTGRNTRLRLGLNGQRREYSGTQFDDMALAAYAGPRFVSRKWDVSVLGTGFQRWYGDDAYSRSAGARIDATHYPTPKLAVFGSLAAQWLDHQRIPEMSGPIYSASLGAYRPLNSSSALTFKIGLNRQDSRVDAYSNWSGYAAVGYYRDLPAGFSIYLEPSVAFARYDDRLPALDMRRSDKSVSGLVTLLNRHIVLSRFTPRIAYTFTRQDSNIPLYRFTRNRIEVGLTTNF